METAPPLRENHDFEYIGLKIYYFGWNSSAAPLFPHQRRHMAERSFVEEVKKLRLGAGEVFSGEGILAVTKALLESGVAYVAGYQGAPISHLMDVLADAQDILQ